MNTTNIFLVGAITTQYLVASLFFYQYSEKTSDVFFKYFSVSFILLAVERIVWLWLGNADEFRPIVYLFRLAAFLLIIAAVFLKNRRSFNVNK